MSIKKHILASGLAALLLLLSSCSSLQISLPAISQENTGRHYNGRVIWHDLLARDTEAAKKFYGGLFGWEFKEIGLYQGDKHAGSYSLILHEGRAIAGMVDTTQLRKDVNLAQWVSVFSTANITAAVSQLKAGGGVVYTEPTTVGERGEIAVVADTQGGLFALLQTSQGDPAEQKAPVGAFLWDELWTADTEKAKSFYQALFGYDAENTRLENGETYHYFASEGQPRAAVQSNPLQGLAPTWVSFIRVEDPAAIVAKVAALGGEVLLDVQQNPIGGQLAIIRDPDGAGFVIQTWDQ
ncbi:hypothetical protein SAMN02745866_04033 [Alteromonadaceae bacterium Bs31]|nr:hypothetical protein SAMN02745866_04033 [Alteromonadaceae bacterium Bs31]